RSERFFMQEIIREKILLNYQKEIPYSVEIEVESFKEEEELIRIRAVVYVERESQKGIIIGRGGTALKKVGTEARQEAEEFFAKKIFLELYVKVAKEWRDKENALRKFGYEFE
ncbi:MAG TPA: KH domain-containing protein, partial [Prolixibacteraceae bacterium]|nr:KH domain-containing protein [Prolixibacteraceae bacterium]